MKIVFYVLLSFLIVNNVFSKDIKTKKHARAHTKESLLNKKFSRVICSQKNIPFRISKSLSNNLLDVIFIAEKKIENFSLKAVRGVDGVAVLSFEKILNQKLEDGDSIESIVELSEYQGLVYIVFDIQVMVNGVSYEYSIPVAVGKISKFQKNVRAKNIITIKEGNVQKGGDNLLTAPVKKLHEIKLDE